MDRVRRLSPLMPFVAALTPFVAFAADITSIITAIQGIVELFIPLLMTIAIALFLYGVVKYITAGGDPEKEKSARGYLIYGIIGLFVLVAFWGIVTVLTSTLGITEGTSPITPTTAF